MKLFKVKSTKYGWDMKRVEERLEYLSTLKKWDVVFAGDSITWLFPLSELINVPAANRGISGDTSDQLLRRWNKTVLSMDPKLIVLLIGVNDISHRRTVEDIANDIFACIDKSIQYNKDIKIILEAVYPTNLVYAVNNKNINKLNAILAERVKDYSNVTFVDFTAELKNSLGSAKSEYFYDGLHPSASGFELVAKHLNPVIEELMK